MIVRAKRTNQFAEDKEVVGYYGLKRRWEGEVFELNDDSHFSSRWMVKVERPEDTMVQIKNPDTKRMETVSAAEVVQEEKRKVGRPRKEDALADANM